MRITISSTLVKVRQFAFGISSACQTLWFRNAWGMHIGNGLKISSSARLDRSNPRGVHIGDWTAIAFDVSILSHDMQTNSRLNTYIGSYCFVGARSIVMAGVRIGDHSIIGAGSVVMSDVPSNSIVSGNPARIVRAGVQTGRWGIINQEFFNVEAAAGRVLRPAPKAVGVSNLPKLPQEVVLELFRAESPSFSKDIIANNIGDVGIDSFGLVNLRVAIERRIGRSIDDTDWQGLQSPADLVSVRSDELDVLPSVRKESDKLPAQIPEVPELGQSTDESLGTRFLKGGEKRNYRVTMPMMAMRGLSESWMMKELGDMHWSTLLRDLQTTSSAIADSNGARLYATFTRIRWRATDALTGFREAEPLQLQSRLSRFGASMFFSHVKGDGVIAKIEANLMTVFSKYGESGANKSLLKGQPIIPEVSYAKEIFTLPEFANEYRALRSRDLQQSIFSCEYDQQPPYDINGAGLLYFASYPIIMELCLLRHVGPVQFMSYSLVERDIYYFSNADSNETIRFILHQYEVTDEILVYSASLVRCSDGKAMAFCSATKRRIELPPVGKPTQPRA